jgi:dTDP-4-dehydrorhamnose reductase
MNKDKGQILNKKSENQRILITGAKGMLGRELVRQLSKLPTTTYQLILTDKEELDITDKKKVEEVIKKIRPDFIIHAAAYVDVDQAEDDKVLCKKINSGGTKNIARVAKNINATLLYISTDYVFDGKKNKPYKETDKPNPLGIYAKTKLDGEKTVAGYCKKHYIIRVAWLFGRAKHKNNFVEKMIGLSKKGLLKVINDQIGSPTSTDSVVRIIKELIVKSSSARKPAYGIYHFSGTGETTRYGFTKEIFRRKKIKAELTPVKTTEFFAKAKRPAYSYLDKSKIEKALKIKVEPWPKMLEKYLKKK